MAAFPYWTWSFVWTIRTGDGFGTGMASNFKEKNVNFVFFFTTPNLTVKDFVFIFYFFRLVQRRLNGNGLHFRWIDDFGQHFLRPTTQAMAFLCWWMLVDAVVAVVVAVVVEWKRVAYRLRSWMIRVWKGSPAGSGAAAATSAARRHHRNISAL